MERTIKKVKNGDAVIIAYRNGGGIIIGGLYEQGHMEIDGEEQKYYKIIVGNYHLTLLEDELDAIMKFKFSKKTRKKYEKKEKKKQNKNKE